jgi:hypothetical protein
MKLQLSTITRIRAGHAFRKKLINDPKEEVRVIQMKDMSPYGEIHWPSMIRTEPAAISREWVSKGDILLVARGTTNRAYFIDEEPGGPTLAAPYFFHITILENQLSTMHPAFLAWQLNQKPAQDYFRSNAEGSTSKAIRREVVENTLLTIPPMNEQLRVILLNKNLQRQRHAYELLILNSEKIMSRVATDLLSKDTT